MVNEYSRTFANLSAFGVPKGQAEETLELSRNLVRFSLMGVPSEVSRYGSLLQSSLESFGIERYLADRDNIVTIDQATEYILGQTGGAVIGLTGKPAAGKTTLCNHLLEDDVVIVDEFWNIGSKEVYQQKQEIVKKSSAKGKIVVVGACQLTSPLVTSRIHLVSPPEVRKHNLNTRLRGLTDKLRVSFFDAYEANDNLMYGLEQIHADVVADATRIRY